MGKCKKGSTFKPQRARTMKDIVVGVVVLVTVTLIIGVIVGASAYVCFDWTPLTHHTFKSCWRYISNWRTFTLIFLGFGVALFVRQVIVILTHNK